MSTARSTMNVWPLVRKAVLVDSDEPCLAHIDRRIRWHLIAGANGLAGLYGQPVWLVGSALKKAWPRDYDFRIVLPDAEFSLRYGGSAEEWEDQQHTGDWQGVRWRWSDDCVHQSKHMSIGLNRIADVQTQPESWWRKHYPDSPRVRLDTRGRFAATITEREF